MSAVILDHRELPSERAAPGLLGLAERGLVPDSLLRLGIRRMCAERLAEEHAGGSVAEAERYARRIDMLRHSPVAIATDTVNAQHYELPPAFFRLCLGPHLKYSSCYFPRGDETLGEAEEAMLALYGERAELANGQHILELGCGWGSLTLWMAEHYSGARITAVSYSTRQRQFIEAECRRRGLVNVHMITCDVNVLDLPPGQFDRCVSIEMFEHMRNYQTLMRRIGNWLAPGGKLFVHIFAHRTLMYPFETEGSGNWMGRHFFTGGLMPAADTLLHFQDALRIERRWLVDGTHYQKSSNAWLERQDARRDEVTAVLREAYGEHASLWFQRWRMFWMACAELFGYAGGSEWMVAHYLFARD
ncbi:MAG: SAM-dependent methyltransferase [Rhodanobacteraceae bacterium]